MFDMRKQLKWAKLKVGLVITLALLVLLATIFFAGGVEKIFSPMIELRVQFQDVRGLRKGAPVWIFGTEVGSVKEIQLDRTLGAVVRISIHRNVQGFIRKDARASILTMGLLGDKYIELSTGSLQAGPIERGEMIKGLLPVEISEIMETAGVSIGKIGEFIEKLDSLLLRIEKGEGTVARFLTDPSVYENLNRGIQTLSLTLEEIKESRGTIKLLLEDASLYEKTASAVSSLEAFAKRINESPGTLKKLVEDPSLYQGMVSAVSSIEALAKKTDASVEEIANKVTGSQGTLHRLLEDPSLYEKTVSAVSSIEQFGRKLNEESGTLKKLIEDPQLYENLNQGLIQLSSILRRIDQGEGVVGALLHDQELVEEMKRTVGELKALMKDIKDHPKKYFKFSIF